jgi:STAM-binding protein
MTYELLSDEMTLSFACFCSLMPTTLNQDGLRGPSTASQGKSDDMLSVLSLDDGRWSLPLEPASVSPGLEAEFSHLNIRQPSPPPVLAQVHPEHGQIPPSRVADPRPGLATSATGRYQNLHVVSSKCSFLFLLPKVHYI